MSAYLDHTQPVRSGEEINSGSLEAFLKTTIPGADGTLVVEQFPSGSSNLTYLLRLGDQELVLRRPPFGNRVKTAHDMGREYRVLSRLHAVYHLAPKPLAYCDDESVIGSPFYIMERRCGIILRFGLPKGLALPSEKVRTLSAAFLDNLAVLHTLDFRAAGLEELGRPEGYFKRQVEGWIKRYRAAQTDDLAQADRIIPWFETNLPPENTIAALIHNDYKYDNVMLDPGDMTRLVAVLDWEMCTIGDPLSDLGTTLGYWVEAGDTDMPALLRNGPTALPGSLTRRELVERYGEKTGFDVSNLLFYYCFGLFKIGVIVQQIYYRYVQGHTRDPRFADFDRTVAAFMTAAVRAADTGHF